MLIYLIRHPRPLVEPGVCYGRFDVDCEAPEPLAARLKTRLPFNVPVVSSPLLRARRLAEALRADARVDARLAEIDFGDWEGRRWEAINRGALDRWAADVLNFIPPGGESVAMLQARAVEFAATLDLPSVALVTHAGVMRALLGHWRGLAAEEWTQLQFDFGGMTVVKL